jgi:hypothetical protein
MSQAFNLTAQINLQAPANLKTVVAGIRRELGSVNANVKLNISSQSARSVSTIKNRIDALNASLVQARNNVVGLDATLRNLSTSLSTISSSTAKVNTSFNTTSHSVGQTTKNIKVATDEMAEFGKQAALAIRRFAAFSIVSTGVFALVNAVNSGLKAFVEFDKEMIKLQQVTGKGEIGLRSLEKEIRNLSTSLGVSSKSLVDVASTLAQAGLSADETRVALAALAKTELAPSFDNLTDTTEGAIAAIRQFGIEAKDLEKALGSINAVAAAFAVESKDIISAIQRTGGVFAASSKGVSEGTAALNEFIAVFTSIRQTTRESAETIATGLRTIFTRIQRAKTIDQLREFGVELTDLEGKFVGPYEAVKRLSAALGSLDPRDLRFSQIVEELGGFRQIGKVIPLIQQFKVAQEALNVAQKGQGSLYAAQITAQKSLAVQLAKVRENFLELVADIGKSKTFQGLFKVVTGLASGLIHLAGAFKPILPILAIFGAIKGISALTRFGTGFVGGLRRGGGLSAAGSNLGSSLSGAKEKDKNDATQKASQAILDNTSAIKTLTTAINSLAANVLDNSKRLAANNGQTLNSGGVVKKFARGGLVPGAGDSDTVPAMLMPGEFVIRKKAVAKLGANNLHKMNRYADGGIVQRFAGGSIVRDIGGVPATTSVIRDKNNTKVGFDNDYYNINANKQIIKIAYNKKDKKFRANRKTIKTEDVNDLIYNNPKSFETWENIVSQVLGTDRLNNKDPNYPIDLIKGKKLYDAKFRPDSSFKEKDAALKALSYRLEQTNSGFKYNRSGRTIRLTKFLGKKTTPGKDDFQDPGSITFVYPEFKNIPTNLKAIEEGMAIRRKQAESLPDEGAGYFARQAVSVIGNSEHISGNKDIINLISMPKKYKSLGGLVQKFMAGGLATVPKSRSEIFKKLPLLEAARAAGIDSTKAYDVMGLRRAPTPEEAGWIEAIQKEYIKKVNRKTGAQNATTTKLENAGLVFGAAGLFGKAFSPVNQTIKSDRLSGSRKVRILSGVIDPNKASEILSIFSQGVGDITSRASSSIRSPGDINSKQPVSPLDINLESTIQGGLLQKAIEALGGPTAIKGKGFDFPEGLQGAAKYFGLPPDIPTDVKRTLAGPSTIKDNIITYLKNVMGYASGGTVRKFANGGIPEAPLIDDIMNGSGTIMPHPSVAIAALIKAGGGAIDYDRTLQRTLGDKAYSRARSESEKEAVLKKYFRDPSARLQDAKTARLTQFGKQLQELIQKGTISPKNLSIISKSKRVPGIAEHISELFGIPVQNMVFTEGGSKSPALDAMRSKGPRINRVSKNLGGIIQTFAVGGKAGKKVSNQLKNERIIVDDNKVMEARQAQLDMQQVKSSFSSMLSRDQLFAQMANFSKIIGVPDQALTSVLPKVIDFDFPQHSIMARYPGPSASFDKTGAGNFGAMEGSGAGGRGAISFRTDGINIASLNNKTLYHELTHQLLHSLREKEAKSFDVYKNIVNNLFDNDNDKVADAIDALPGNHYTSADIAYGRRYKISSIDNILRQAISGKAEDKLDKQQYGDMLDIKKKAEEAKMAKQFKPINPAINTLLRLKKDQNTIDHLEDMSKEEFLTTLVENIPSLDSHLSSILDNTLSQVMGAAGITRQKFAKGGSAQDTVPALLTPGEFVINKKAAQKIGYSKLHKMNKADKIQGYNAGGPVQYFNDGSTGNGVSSPLSSPSGVTEKQLGSILKILVLQEKNTRTQGGQKLINQIKDAIAKQSLGIISASDAIVDIASGIRSFAIENKKSGNEDRANSLKGVFDRLDRLQKSQGGSSLIQATNSKLGMGASATPTQATNTTVVPGPSGLPPGGSPSPSTNPANNEAQKRKEEQNEYFAYRAKQSGQTVGGFRSVLASKVVSKEKDLATNLENQKTGFRYMALGQSSSLKGSTDKKQLKAAKAEFASKLKEIDPDRSAGEIDKAAKRLVIALRKGADSFDTIVKNDTVLSDILAKTRTSAENAAIAFDEVAKENGLTADVLREQISSKNNKQYRQQKFVQSDAGQRYGRLAEMAPDMVAQFANTKTGQKLGGAADFASGKGIVTLASKKLGDGFGNALDGWLKKLGGPMTVLGAGLSVLGDKLPDITASLGYGQSETAAGVAGGIAGAGQGLASGALLGGQIAGPVGALIGGVSGAIITGIAGVFNGINTKRLENNLRELDKTTTALDIAFKRLDENASDKNLQDANSKFADTLNSLSKVGGQANFGAGGISRVITESLRGIDPTGLVSAVTGGQTEAESRQALVSGLTRASSDADRLGSVTMSKASTDSISKLLDQANASGDKTTAFARSNQGYQAMRRAGMGEQEIFLSKYISEQNQQGKTSDQISKELSDPKKREEAIKRGKELLAVDGELALKQALVARSVKDLMIANEQLLEVYRKASAGLDRYSKELERFDAEATNAAGSLTGDARMLPVKSKNEEVLNNISAYSTDEVKAAANEAASIAGGGDSGNKLKNDIMTAKLLKDELPKALRSTTGNDAGDVVDKLEEAFKNMSVPFPDSLKKQLSEGLMAKTAGNREGSGMSDLADQAGSLVEELFKGPEAGLKFAQELLTKYNDTINKSINKLEEYNDTLSKAEEWQRKAVNIRLTAELDLAQALGKSPTLAELNNPVDVEMRSMTKSLIPGGSTDPTQIGNAMMAGAKNKEVLQGRLNNPANYDVKTEAERTAAIKKDTEALAKQNKALNDGHKALEKLATDGTKAANALSKIQERKQLAENGRSLSRKLLTSDSSELADFSRQMGAYNRVASGNASNKELGNLQTRRDAFAGLDNIKGMLPESMGKQMEARLQRQMLMANPDGQKILDSVIGVGSDGNKMTMDQALKDAESGKDPVQEEYIKAYKDATDVQARAAQALADNALESSKILAKASQEMLDKISTLGTILPNAQAEAAAAKPEVEKPKDPTGTLSAEAAGPGSINIPGLSNVADSNKQLIDAIKALIAAIVALKIAYMAAKTMGMFKNMPGMPKMTGLGLKQITGPMKGGAGAFGTSAGGGAAGAAAGAATAAGAAYGGFVAIDWLNSINELMTDFDGKMSELNSRASKQLDQGYFQNVLQNLMEPGDSLIDLFSGLDEWTGNIVGSAVGLKNRVTQRSAEVQKTMQNMEENAKTKKGVVDEKTGEMTMVERDKNDHMRGIGLSDQIDVKQSARLMFEIKKAKEAKNSGKSVGDFEQITGADAGAYRNQDFDTIIKEKEKQLLDRNKGKKDTTQLKDAKNAEIRQLEEDANNRVADAKKEAATVAATKPETVSEKPQTATPETPKPQTEAEATQKTAEAAKPQTEAETTQKTAEAAKSESSTAETTKETKTEEAKPKDSLETSSNNKPVYMTVLEKIASLLGNKGTIASLGSSTTSTSVSPEEIKKLEQGGVMDHIIGTNADGSHVSVRQSIYGSGQQSAAQTTTQSAATESSVASATSPQTTSEPVSTKKVSDLSTQQSYRFRKLMMKGNLRVSEEGLPVGRTPEEEKEYEALAQQKKDANPQIAAKIRERELKNKGKLRVSEDGLPIGRSPEEEKEYGQIVSNKPLTPYQQAQQSKREAYLARFRPEVREKMLTPAERAAQQQQSSVATNGYPTPSSEVPTQTGPLPTSIPTQQISQASPSESAPKTEGSMSGTGYSITLDENSRKFLETFSTTINSFGSYMNQLNEISTRFKDKIEVTGDYTVQVNLSGAAAIEALDKKMKEMAESIVSKSDFELFRREVSRAVPSVKDPAATGRTKQSTDIVC